MSARRLLATAVLATAALTLTGCGPDVTTTAGSSPTAAMSPTSAPSPATPTAAASPSAAASSTKPSSAKPTAVKPTTAKPTADCTANAAGVGTVIKATAVGYATHVWMKALDTKFICGPDIPDDGYFEGYGAVKLYSFSNDVKTSVLVGTTQQPVELNDFMAQADTCLTSPNSVQGPRGCFGNEFVVTVTGANVITSIKQLYHP